MTGLRLRAYLTAVVMVAAGTGTLLVASRGLQVEAHEVVACVLLGTFLVVAELFPIQVPRSDQVTLSHTFGLALLIIAPPWVALAATAVALLADAVVNRRDWRKQPFNIAMHVVSYVAAAAVYDALGALDGDQRTTTQVLAAALGGLTFLFVNNAVMAGLLAIVAGRDVIGGFLADIRWMSIFNVPAAALAPVLALCALANPWLLLFALSPLVAVYRSGMLASKREYDALHDPLTGLGNRAMITDVLDELFRPGEQDDRHAVLLVDLDHFKDVNDTLGHHVGDALLCTAAEVLSSVTPDTGLVARLGGDEFAVLLRDSDLAEASDVAERILAGLRQPRLIEGISLRTRGSVGIALFPDDGTSRAEVLRRADVALYKAKEGRDGHVAYEPGHDRSALDQLTLANELASVLDEPRVAREQLFLTYQPLVAAADGSLRGVECLLRWAHPRLGLLLPDAFLPLAEHAGLTGAVGRHVLDLAVGQQRAWADARLDLCVSVNLAAADLADAELPDVVADTLARHGVRPDRLVVEVTENGLVADPERSSALLQRIRATGTYVSIDDYGTGYSSLAYVKQFDVDELKIDRQFAASVNDDVTDRIIVQSTIDLAHQLGLLVVAEGIEDLATAAVLRDMGCDVLQGYALGRPGPAHAVTGWIPVELPERAAAPGLHVVGAGRVTA